MEALDVFGIKDEMVIHKDEMTFTLTGSASLPFMARWGDQISIFTRVRKLKVGDILSNRNATASWSGYLHQGKVGILVCLKQINKLLSQDRELSGWYTEYESAEDIDLKYKDRVISRHQVKAYKDGSYPNDYKDVLATQSYVIKKKIKVLETHGFQICQFNEKASPKRVEVDDDSRFLHTITEIKGFGLNQIEFHKAFPKAKYVPNPNNIQLYVYPDGKSYCGLFNNDDRILTFCKNEIKSILNTVDDHPFKNSDSEHENIFKKLVGILDCEIRKSHIKGSDFYPTLYLNEIHNEIISEEQFNQTITEAMREKFVDLWTEYMYELDDNDIDFEDKQMEKVNEIIKTMYTLNDDEFIQLLKDINPDQHNIQKTLRISNVADLCKVDSFKEVFYECLVQVTRIEFDLFYKGYKESGGYLLTLINRPKNKVGTVISNMMKNQGTTDDIFNRRYLINDRIDNISFDDFIQRNSGSSKVNSDWSRTVTPEDVFYNPNLEFISTDKAITKLNRKGV